MCLIAIASGGTDGQRLVQRALTRCWNISNDSCAYRYVEVLEMSDLEAGFSDDIDFDMAVYEPAKTIKDSWFYRVLGKSSGKLIAKD